MVTNGVDRSKDEFAKCCELVDYYGFFEIEQVDKYAKKNPKEFPKWTTHGESYIDYKKKTFQASLNKVAIDDFGGHGELRWIDLTEEHRKRLFEKMGKSMERGKKLIAVDYDKSKLEKSFEEVDLGEDFIVFNNDFYDTWEKVKGHVVNLMNKNEDNKMLFGTHVKDVIYGKPQLVYDTIQNIPVVIKIGKIDKKTKEVIESYKFFDDSYNRRDDGYEIERLSKKFWIYKVVSGSEEYFVLSLKKLEDKLYTFTGMKVEMNNVSEMTKTFKIRSIKNVFISVSAESSK